MARMSFGHLIGLGRPQTGKSAAEDDEEDDERMEDDDTDEENDDTSASAEDDDEPDESAEDDDSTDDDDDDKQESKAVKRARLQERQRCAAIFGAKAAAGNIPLAAHLAFNTGMSAKVAIAALAAAPGAKPGLADRMAGMGKMRVSSAAGPASGSKQDRVSRSWDAASRKAGIQLR